MVSFKKIAPIHAFILIYIWLMVMGVMLLSLPGMAIRQLSNMETLFTSISAVTLTGLQICNFAEVFTAQGQIVVLFLIESGAIVIISFCLYFGWLIGKGSLFTESESLLGTGVKPIHAYLALLKKTIIFLVCFELISSGILYAFWNGDIHYTISEKLQYAFFHGVSVFTHSGFSNLDGSFSNPHLAHSYLLLLAVTGVIVLGSVGYATIFDLISIKRLRERMLNPKMDWMLQTRIALYSTLVLIVGGSIYWFISEQHKSLEGQKMVESVFTSIFNVAGARSAGFYSVHVNAFSQPLLWVYLFLMFVGVSATSPGGGIKSSVLYASFFGKTTRMDWRAKAAPFFAVIIIMLSYYLLRHTDPFFSKSALQFEVFSAFTNTGLSYGITPEISDPGKYVLMVDMILGRVGLPILLYTLLIKRPDAGNGILMI